MSSTRPSAISAWIASRPAPPAASTTGGRCRGCAPTRCRNNSAGTSCPPSGRPSNWRPRACWPRAPAARARHRRPCRRPATPRPWPTPRSAPVRRCRPCPTAPRCRPGRRRTPTPTSMARRRPKSPSPPRWPATCASPRSGASTTPTISCSTSAPCRFRCSKASPSPSCRRGWTPTAGRTTRASIRSPARATVNGRATTMPRSPSSVCSRTTRAIRCAAWPATSCAT